MFYFNKQSMGNFFDHSKPSNRYNKQKKYANQWEGNLTDETLQEMVKDYQGLVREAEAA